MSVYRKFLIFPVSLAFLVQLQVDLPVGASNLRVNLADLLIAPLILWFFKEVLSKKLRPPKFIAKQIPYYALTITAVFTYGLIIGWLEIGDWTAWALANKYIGWFVLLAYFFVGAMVVHAMPKEGAWTFCLVFICFLVTTTLLHAIPDLLTMTGTIQLIPALTGNPLNPRQLSGFVGNPNSYAFFLLVGVALMIVVDGRLEKVSRAIPPAIMCILIIGLWYTASRAAWIALLALLVGAAFRQILPYRNLLVGAVCASAVIGGSILIDPHNPTASEQKLVSMVQSAQPNNLFPRPADTERNVTFQSAIELWRNNPFFGAGLGVHMVRSPETGDGTKKVIHNTALWILAEFGLVGVIPFIVCFIHVFVLLWRRRSDRRSPLSDHGLDYEAALWLVLIAFATMSVAHEMLYQRIMWLLAGMALVDHAESHSKSIKPS